MAMRDYDCETRAGNINDVLVVKGCSIEILGADEQSLSANILMPWESQAHAETILIGYDNRYRAWSVSGNGNGSGDYRSIEYLGIVSGLYAVRVCTQPAYQFRLPVADIAKAASVSTVCYLAGTVIASAEEIPYHKLAGTALKTVALIPAAFLVYEVVVSVGEYLSATMSALSSEM